MSQIIRGVTSGVTRQYYQDNDTPEEGCANRVTEAAKLLILNSTFFFNLQNLNRC